MDFNVPDLIKINESLSPKGPGKVKGELSIHRISKPKNNGQKYRSTQKLPFKILILWIISRS